MLGAGGECLVRYAWRWCRAVAFIVVLLAGGTVAALWLSPSHDFMPFVMTIEEWDRARVTNSDGGTIAGSYVYRLEYHRRDDWKMTLVHDDLGADLTGEVYECRDGVWFRFDADGHLNTRVEASGYCDGVGRWIHYGIAQQYVWVRTVTGDRVTYTDEGERIVLDRATGLPILYEVSSRDGVVGHRITFRVERYGSS